MAFVIVVLFRSCPEHFAVPLCMGFHAENFQSFFSDSRVHCGSCEAHPDCDRTFYRLSLTKQKLDPESWCSKGHTT